MGKPVRQARRAVVAAAATETDLIRRHLAVPVEQAVPAATAGLVLSN